MTREIRLVQTWYPQIYLACHTAHTTRRSPRAGLTARDSSLLAHLDERRRITASELASHFGVGRPALSAAVKRLVRLGYVRLERNPDDRRLVHLLLTREGAAAMRESSVLESDRVRRLLGALSPDERTRALEGLSLLAQAARAISSGERRA